MSVHPSIIILLICLFLICAALSVFYLVDEFKQRRSYGRVFLSTAQRIKRTAITVSAFALLFLISFLSSGAFHSLFDGIFLAAGLVLLLFFRSEHYTNLLFYLRGPSEADRKRILQMAVNHKPDYIFADADMTVLSPEVSEAMRLVFPGRARLEQALEAKTLPDLEQADTDALLVLLKYATILPEDEAVLSFREAIIHTLKRWGV